MNLDPNLTIEALNKAVDTLAESRRKAALSAQDVLDARIALDEAKQALSKARIVVLMDAKRSGVKLGANEQEREAAIDEATANERDKVREAENRLITQQSFHENVRLVALDVAKDEVKRFALLVDLLKAMNEVEP